MKCHCCGELCIPHKMNGIYSKCGHLKFCQEKECQEMFIEMAGDPPDYDFDGIAF